MKTLKIATLFDTAANGKAGRETIVPTNGRKQFTEPVT